jgi:hypothetical protein
MWIYKCRNCSMDQPPLTYAAKESQCQSFSLDMSVTRMTIVHNGSLRYLHMHVCMHVFIYIQMCVCMFVCCRICMLVYLYICWCICTYVGVFVHMLVYLYICWCVCMFVCWCVCMFCVYGGTYVHMESCTTYIWRYVHTYGGMYWYMNVYRPKPQDYKIKTQIDQKV